MDKSTERKQRAPRRTMKTDEAYMSVVNVARDLRIRTFLSPSKQRRAREAALPPASTSTRKSPKEEAALSTVKTVLSLATSDDVVRTTFLNTVVPSSGNSNLFDTLTKIAEEGRITPEVAGSLSHVLVKLAKSEVLFSPLPSLPQETMKRKRDGLEEDTGPPEKRATV